MGSAGTYAERADALAEHLQRRTGRPADGVWAAPGRVNLIGEHTDYNEGYALPIAIDRIAIAVIATRTDGVIRCWSAQEDGAVDEHEHGDAPPGVRIRLADVGPDNAPKGWAAYPAGVAWALAQQGIDVPGFDLLLDSTVPVGAGVSSSAAMQCSVALALAELTGSKVDRTGLALAGQRAENDIVGAPTGFMDQMASMLATEGNALFLDCRSRETQQVPFDLPARGATLLVIDTRTEHAHADGGYRARRESCERAVQMLGVQALRDVDLPMLQAHEGQLDEETFRRARHVVTDDDRVLRTVASLHEGDLAATGRLLTQSHASMRDDFEISTPELDLAVDTANAFGALGARMTGGGFGGSAIALVRTQPQSDVDGAIRRAFADKGFTAPEIFSVTAAQGAWRVR